MIRRDTGDAYVLITQHDHALISGELARHIGNEAFARPEPYDPTMQGIALHDCGWPLHDENPTLNGEGLPLDVFESPRDVALAVWRASAERATQVDPYAGLLASLHTLNLSATALATPAIRQRMTPHDLFESNRFQHQEVERQEQLRRQLNLATDRPLRYGIGVDLSDPRERELHDNLKLLQAMDLLSLALCCTKPPTAQTPPLAGRDTRVATPLGLKRINDDVAVNPWPFDVPQITLTIAGRSVPRTRFESLAAFRAAYAAAPRVEWVARVMPSPADA